jgi:23S rRNA (uracil1939-C5)-methyltransferase
VGPSCPHFGTCGGCTLYHLPEAAYIALKSELLATALRRAGFADIALSQPTRIGPGERRRMDLAARRGRGGVVLGLHRQRSADVVDLTTCLVLHQTLVSLMPPLRELLARLHAFRREGSVIANLIDSGVDLLVRTDASLELSDRVALTEFARTHRLPRIAWALGSDEPEPIAILRPPTTLLSGITVLPPSGAFLQASAAGEAAIISAVVAALPDEGRVAELFSGCGAITFALAQRSRVAAWEGDTASASALRTAANHAGLAGKIEAIQRDLARQPLQAKELAGFAAVVLNPPAVGAAAQVAQIAAAKPPVVVYVSCNPATLSRDARQLRQAGFMLRSATPIDQFLWSARLESVCVFSSAPAARRRAAAV